MCIVFDIKIIFFPTPSQLHTPALIYINTILEHIDMSIVVQCHGRKRRSQARPHICPTSPDISDLGVHSGGDR
jgi:hypothetical protein